jgi:hypothetical protein
MILFWYSSCKFIISPLSYIGKIKPILGSKREEVKIALSVAS